MLFAFLLAVPFSRGYPQVTEFEKIAFFVSLIATALSSALLIAMPSFHRLRFRVESKGHIVQLGNKLAIAGFFFLAVAMVAALIVVSSFLFGKGAGIATGVSVGVVFAALWYGLALRAGSSSASSARRARSRRSRPDGRAHRCRAPRSR